MPNDKSYNHVVKIAYLDRGRGKVILFIHGWLIPKEAFLPLINLLSRKYRCIALDLPGFGETGGEFDYAHQEITKLIAEFMDKFKIKKYSLFGSSLGGAVALHLLTKYPTKVDRVILRNPFLSSDQLPKIISNPIAIKLLHWLAQNPVFYETFLKIARNRVQKLLTCSPKEIDLAVINNFHQLSPTCAREIWFAQVRNNFSLVIRKYSRKIMIINNTKDEFLNSRYYAENRESFENIKLVNLDSDTHFLFHDDFPTEAEIVEKYLSGS